MAVNSTRTRANARFRHTWTCPQCGFVNRWIWPSYDRPALGADSWLFCNGCPHQGHMSWAGDGVGWRYLGESKLSTEKE
jgi:hypothetical protein